MQEQSDFSELTQRFPEPAQARAHKLLAALMEAGGEVPAERARDTARVFASSEFVAQSCIRTPALLADLHESGDLDRDYKEGEYRRRLGDELSGVSDDNGLAAALRRFRRREMVRIAWRDLAGRAGLNVTVEELSALAEACIDHALICLHGWHCEQWGTPLDSEGRPQQMVVIGMGKLGARELNFCSDIDLIFTYPEDGETNGGRRQIPIQQFFIRLGQRLIQALDAQSADGFVFRVDMRLRPFGESSALALSFDGLEEYYQVHGREWERYAMIKARVVGGDREAGAELMARLKPFVYRRYLDYGAFESLREMKALIAREVRRKGMDDNVKLGPGGIREVEFIGQAFQLIRGGREPTLQVRRILSVLEALRGFDLLPDYVVRELVDAYVFLRNTEHRLQEFAEQQTHLLPDSDERRSLLAFAMGFADWAGFEHRLRAHMERVHQHFEQVFAAPQTEHAESDELDLAGVWLGTQDEAHAHDTLAAVGLADPAEALKRIEAVRGSNAYRGLSAQGRERMDRLMPLLLGAVGQAEDPDAALPRLLHLVETVARRTAYLALLIEHPMALSQLVRLCGASPWIAHHLARYPLLLDELLDPRTLYAPPGHDERVNELRQRMLSTDDSDLEAQMDGLRHFKQSNVLRVAAADVMEAVPLMVVSDHLTDIAEVVLDEVLELAWRYLVARHGRPLCGDDRVCDKGFAIIGYGKLGGIELGYGSDLDIVFLHSEDSHGRATTGDKPLDNPVFYARLGQRVIHLLNTRTAAGVLYEVDTRLRPSGASGLLVSGVDAYAEYQQSQAWTWEHQALVRARVVAGDPGIAEAFEQVRRDILGRKREPEALRKDVREMRERMRRELAKSKADQFDIKQDRGGIADIEFMVQYGVLAWAHDHPSLLEYTDNIRILEAMAAAGLLPETDVSFLSDAYRAYRARAHRLTLQEKPAVVAADELQPFSDGVAALWRGLMEE